MSRSNLADLVRDRHPPVVAVSAPAGYGKSTLMAQWARHDDRKHAWVSLTRADNDPVVLLTLVTIALDALQPVDPSVFDDLASPGASILGRVIPRLAASLVNAEPFLMLLDDLHEVDNQECRDALTLLVDHLPPRSTVVAASRGEIWLNVARRRVRGELVEIGSVDLAFGFRETVQLLAGAGIDVGADAAADLHSRTEGWPTGLYLGALAVREARDQTKAVKLFAGDDRFVADYIRSEILDRATPDVRLFLTRTSVLDELCGSLCDQTLDSSGSAATLASLEASNLFLVPLDHRREWYRYHALFRDVLLTDLNRSEPDIISDLHTRASEWYEQNGRIEAAIEHAMASGDRDRAALLVCRGGVRAYFSGRGARAAVWMARFSDSDIERHPWLALQAAWNSAFTGDPIAAVRWADAAELGSFVGRPPDGSASIESARAMLRVAMCANGVTATLGDAELSVSKEPPWSPWRSVALNGLFWARYVSSDKERAEATLEDMIELHKDANHPNSAWASSLRTLLAMERGEWSDAGAQLEQARTLISALHCNEYGSSAVTFTTSARLAMREQDMQAARDYLAHAMRLRPQFTWALPARAIHLRLELAKGLLALADPAGARGLLREIDEILHHRPDLGMLLQEVDDLRNKLATLPAGTVGVSTLTPAELRLLPYLQTHLTHNEIGQRLYISLNTVRTQTQSIYRKLDVTSRAAAVEQARRVGLLAG